MTTYIEEFVALLGFEVDSKDLDKFEKRSEKLKKTLGGIGKVASLAVGALTGVVGITNHATAETDALAGSVDLTTSKLIAMGNALKPIGFGVENVVDLVEEMNNKIGESSGLGEQMTAVKEATHILGLEFRNIKDLAPEDQFYEILDAALQLEDAQQAASAVDMLTGGEGNRIVGFLRDQGKGIREVIAEQERLNFLTGEGVAGARKMDRAVGDLITIGKSFAAQFSGQLGKVLAPTLEALTEILIANEELIQSEILKWAEDAGRLFEWIFETVKDIAEVVGTLVQAVGGLKNALRILLVVIGLVVGTQFVLWVVALVGAIKAAIVAIGGLAGALRLLKLAAVGLKWLAIFGLLFLIIEDIFGFLNGKDSVVGDLSKEFENLLESVNAYWAAVFNMDKEQFRRNTVGFMEQEWTAYFKDAGSWWVDFFRDVQRGLWNFSVGMTEGLRSWINSVLEAVEARVGEWWSMIKGKFHDGVAEISLIFVNFGNAILGFFTGIGDAIQKTINDAIYYVQNKIVGFAKSLPAPMQDFLGVGAVKSFAAGAAGSIPGGGGGVSLPGAGIVSGLQNFGAGLVSNFRSSGGAAPGGASISVTVPTNLNVSQQGSMSPEELTRKVSKAIGSEVARAVRNNSQGVKN